MAAFSPVWSLLNNDDLPTEDLPIREIVSKGLENLYIILASIINNMKNLLNSRVEDNMMHNLSQVQPLRSENADLKNTILAC